MPLFAFKQIVCYVMEIKDKTIILIVLVNLHLYSRPHESIVVMAYEHV